MTFTELEKEMEMRSCIANRVKSMKSERISPFGVGGYRPLSALLHQMEQRLVITLLKMPPR